MVTARPAGGEELPAKYPQPGTKVPPTGDEEASALPHTFCILFLLCILCFPDVILHLGPIAAIIFFG